MWVLLVGADHRRHDLRLVAEALRERRAQRTVREAAREDGVLGGAAFSAEERAGDLARRIGPLLDVDGEGEEVNARTDVVGGIGGRQHGRRADGRHDRALALRRQVTGLEGQGALGPRNGTAHADGISHKGLLSSGEAG